jgi:hypothetical protein
MMIFSGALMCYNLMFTETHLAERANISLIL